MEISKLKGSNKRTGLCRLAIQGDMSIYQAAELMQMLAVYLNEYKDFELDLSAVSEMDTSGIQCLLVIYRRARQSGNTLRLIAMSSIVEHVLSIYRITDKFHAEQQSKRI